MIYLGSPYSHPDPAVMEERFTRVSKETASLLNAGFMVYCPIAHCHPLAAAYDLPRDSDFWYRHNVSILRHCEALYVLRLEGWEESVGLKREIEFAGNAYIPIKFRYVSEVN